jgi:4-amino-4-deoxy-L-arabinose transferase-like glycosyltransferase
MGLSQFCECHFRVLACLTLTLAAFNLGFRLDREVVTPWDEALYATSAAEMVQSGDWIVTTYGGQPDYYNAKPPLNVWLMATAFRLFGVNLIAIRLASVLGAFIRIALLQWWCRQCFGASTALISTIVLSTTFDFLYVIRHGAVIRTRSSH